MHTPCSIATCCVAGATLSGAVVSIQPGFRILLPVGEGRAGAIRIGRGGNGHLGFRLVVVGFVGFVRFVLGVLHAVFRARAGRHGLVRKSRFSGKLLALVELDVL